MHRRHVGKRPTPLEFSSRSTYLLYGLGKSLHPFISYPITMYWMPMWLRAASALSSFIKWNSNMYLTGEVHELYEICGTHSSCSGDGGDDPGTPAKLLTPHRRALSVAPVDTAHCSARAPVRHCSGFQNLHRQRRESLASETVFPKCMVHTVSS